MPRARLSTDPATEYELVRILDDGSYVLRVEGDHRVFEPGSVLEHVEVRCDRCSRWSSDAAPHPILPDRWECDGGECDRVGVEMASAEEGDSG